MLASLIVAIVVTTSGDTSSPPDRKTYDAGSGVVLVCAMTRNSSGGFMPHGCDVVRDDKVVVSHLDIWTPEMARASKSGAHLFSVRSEQVYDDTLVITDLNSGQSTQGEPGSYVRFSPSPDGSRAIVEWVSKDIPGRASYDRASYLMDMETGATRRLPIIDQHIDWSRDSSSYWWESRGADTNRDIIFHKVASNPANDATYPITASWSYVLDVETGLMACESLACVHDGCRGSNDLLVGSIYGGAPVRLATKGRAFEFKWLPGHELEYVVGKSKKHWSPPASMTRAP